MKLNIACCSLLLITLFSSSLAQNNGEVSLKLALEFYADKEYEKSIDLLEELFKENKSKEVYYPLINAYLALERYQDAEKTIKKQLRDKPSSPIYQVDFGYVLFRQGDDKKGEDVYEDAIKGLKSSTHEVIALSNSFQRREQAEWAIETLLHGKKLTGSTYGYEFELGDLYFQTGKIEAMIEEYLDLIQSNEGYLQNVQTALNTTIYNDLQKENLHLLNQALLKRIQRNPERDIFSEMLIWHYLQQKEFDSAIRQAMALDRRNNENGRRFLSLAQDCRSNRKYDLAMECYQYLIDKGPSNQHYINARVLMTETIKDKITSAPYTDEDLKTIETNYIQTLKDIGQTSATINLQLGLAEIWAFYMDKSDRAVEMLENALAAFQLRDSEQAKCKLLLGDIYLSIDEIWEASLLYSQVEKDFKYDALGDEAKFRNAKVFFYTGDFNWAKAQLDVLKGSTSKLIANDAMRLSLVIGDNLTFDTTGAALKKYASALLSYEQNRFEHTLAILDTMERVFIANAIIDEVYFLKYETLFKMQDYQACLQPLNKILTEYSDGILADEALFKLADLYDYYLKDIQQAQEYYKQLFTEYPASIRVAEARKRFRQIRGDDIN